MCYHWPRIYFQSQMFQFLMDFSELFRFVVHTLISENNSVCFDLNRQVCVSYVLRNEAERTHARTQK